MTAKNTIRLYSGPLSMFGAKAHIAALEKGVEVDLVMVPFDQDDRYQPKHPDVVRINPKGQVPVLIDGDLEIFDSSQIFEYLEDRFPAPPLWPVDIKSRARARLLEHMSDEVYFPHVIKLMGLQDNIESPAAKIAVSGARKFYREMEARLDGSDWLAGDYSFADIAFFMAQLFGERMGATLDDETPQVIAWRKRMTSRPAVREGVSALVSHLQSNDRPVPGFLRD